MITSIFVANVIRIIHYILMLSLLFGIFLPSKYLIYYIFLWPAVYLHWYFNGNRCMLTELESNFDQKFISVNNHEEVLHHKYVEIFENLKKINIYFDNMDSFTSYFYNVVVVLWIVGIVRLLHYYKKNIFYIWTIVKKPLTRRLVNDKYK